MSAYPSFKHPKACIICIGLILASLFCCNSPASSPPKTEGNEPHGDTLTTNVAVRLNELGDSAVDNGNYPAAIAFYQQSMDSAAMHADSFPYYDSMLDIACVHDRLSELDKSIAIAKIVTEAYIRSGDSSRIGRGYTTLSAFYGRANKIEEQIITAKKGLEIVKKHGSLIECCAAYNQLAFTYTDQKRWAEALPMLDSALILMEASKVVDQLSSIYLNLGNCHRNLQNWERAQHYLQKSADLADSLGQTHIKSVATLRLSQVAEAQGNYSSALSLFKQSATLKDSVLNKQKIEHIHSMEVAYETKEKAMEINTLKLTQKAERSDRNLTYVLSVLGLSFLGFFLLQARQKLKYTKQTLIQNQQELKDFVTLLNAKNAQLLKLENALHKEIDAIDKPLNSEKEDITEPDFNEEDVDNLFFNSRILTFEDWEAFKHRFEQANPGYLLRIRKAYAALTSAEERLFLLIKLRFSTQEIADTLGISINGVKKGRQRLRKRLALQSEDDLDLFILSF